MNQGRIVEYIDQGNFISTICLQDDGNRLHLLTLSNREINLSPKRVLLISGAPVSSLPARESLLSRLKQTEERRSTLQGDVQVKDLWELVREEKESFDSEYLAELCFGESPTDDHVSALVRALFRDKLYFKMKDGRFLPNSLERIDREIREKEEAALKEERLNEGAQWLKQVCENRVTEDPSCKSTIVDLLIELALYGDDAPSFRFGRELLSKAGISDIGEARPLLVRLGVWEEDENLDLLRFHIKTGFREEVLNESQQVARLEIDKTGREDLGYLHAITIDGPLTKDFDDALSLEVIDGVIHLGIHISDVAGIIPGESILDKEAAERGSSLYLPRHQIPMIPASLSEDALSLKLGCERRAISLMCRFDRDGKMLDYRFTPSLIKIKRQLTYEQVNDLYRNEDVMQEMYRLSEVMRQRRIEQGALILSLPELVVSVDADSRVSIKMVPQETPARMIVAEFMVFYNWMVARFCRESRIPILYRAQERPGEIVPVNESNYPYSVLKQRSKLSPLEIDTKPRSHSGLGLEVYTNATSPIRRYFDLVIQRQIRDFLLGRSPHYHRDGLEKVRMGLDPILKCLEKVKRSRNRYWVQKYLLQHMDETFPAVVLTSAKTKYRIVLTDFLLITEMKRIEGQGFSEGQRIMVKIKKCDPWNDVLRLECVRQ